MTAASEYVKTESGFALYGTMFVLYDIHLIDRTHLRELLKTTHKIENILTLDIRKKNQDMWCMDGLFCPIGTITACLVPLGIWLYTTHVVNFEIHFITEANIGASK